MTRFTKVALTSLLAVALVFAVAAVAVGFEITPAAFADHGTCSSNSGGQCQNPVPVGATPQPSGR